MHAVIFQVEFIPGREHQQEAELDFLSGMMKTAPGFVRGTWMGDDRRGLSCLIFESEAAAKVIADSAAMPPDASAALRSVDVLAVVRDI